MGVMVGRFSRISILKWVSCGSGGGGEEVITVGESSSENSRSRRRSNSSRVAEVKNGATAVDHGGGGEVK